MTCSSNTRSTPERRFRSVLAAACLLLAARLLANVRARGGQWDQSSALLDWIGMRSGWRDASMLADLAFARLRQGHADESGRLARRAIALQPASQSVRQIERLIAPGKPPNRR